MENDSNAHDVDTAHGQSGAALRAVVNGKEVIVGVHSRGKSGMFYDYNEAYFLSADSISVINKWIKQDK